MRKECVLTDGVMTAWQFSSLLLIQVEGMMPTPCHRIKLKRSPERVVPPNYSLLACHDPETVCADVVTPFKKLQVITWPYEMRSITIHTASGDVAVPIEILTNAIKVRDIDFPWPYLSKLKAGGNKTKTGFSERWSFDEAFADAVSQLRAMTPNPGPDYLWRFKTVESGAVEGGIAGLSHLYVVVEQMEN